MFDFSVFATAAGWTGLLALTAMEIVLGIDNIIFVSILVTALPNDKQKSARVIGMTLALALRIGLLFAVSIVIQLSHPFTEILGNPVSGRDIVVFLGGLFLIYKATTEIYEKLEGEESTTKEAGIGKGLMTVVIQIALLNIIFSLDSIITAIGMTDHIEIMMIAVVLSLIFMVAIGGPVGKFVLQHPSVKMLALSFLLLIGVSLVAEAFHKEIPKPYIYSAMAFSAFVEALNFVFRRRAQRKVVRLHQTYVETPTDK